MNTKNLETIVCPHCKGNNIWKFGMYHNRQRYRCKDCLKTFTEFTNEPWSYSKKSIYLWDEFIRLMKIKKTLRECSNELKISLCTAFCWRHKLLNKISNKFKDIKLENEVSIMKTKIMENRKGKRNLLFPPREMHFTYAIDTNRNFLIDVYCGIISVKMYDEIFKEKVNKTAKILRTNNRIINRAALNFNKKVIDEKGFEVFKRYGKYIKWLVDFKGIATKNQVKYHNYFNNIGNLELVLKS